MKGKSQGTVWRALAPHLVLFGLFAIFALFFFIPWLADYDADRGNEYQEGRRAYLALARALKPNLPTCLRGLNMAETRYHMEWSAERRMLVFPGVRIYFDKDGNFLDLEQSLRNQDLTPRNLRTQERQPQS